MVLFRKLSDRLSALRGEVVAAVAGSAAISLALRFERLSSEDVPRDRAIELIRDAAGTDTSGLADFAQELAGEAKMTNDPLFIYVSGLFSWVAESRPPPPPDPIGQALFPAIRRMGSAPTLDDAVSELVVRSPELQEVVQVVQSRTWEAARPTTEVAADLAECIRPIGDRLGRESPSDDPLLLDLSRRVFLDYLLMLTGRAPEDEDEQ